MKDDYVKALFFIKLPQKDQKNQSLSEKKESCPNPSTIMLTL